MEIPLRAAQLTGFAELAPQERSLFFFTPLRHDQGHLIDLQLFQGDQSVVGADSSGPCLSDWIAPQSGAYLPALWSALEQGVGYSLDYQLSDQTAGNLTITPLSTGYLVEIQAKDVPPSIPSAPDPLLVLMRGQLQKEQHQQLTGSLLQSIHQRVPCQQANVYLLDQPHQSAQTPIQLVEGQPNGPGCLPKPSWDDLRGGKPIIDQQIGEHTPGLAAALYPVGYRSFMLVPLLEKEQLLGALLVMDQKAHFFTASYQAVVLELAQALSRNPPPVADQAAPTNLDVTSQLLEAIVFNTPVGLALFRPCWQQGQITDFTYLLTNPANALLTGRSIAQMAAQSLKTLFPETTQGGLFERLVAVAQTGVSQHYQEQARQDGLSLWGQFMLCRVGENVLFSVMDITPLQRAQARLHKKNGQLRKRMVARTKQISDLWALQEAIVNHAGQAIIATDTKGRIRMMNQAAEKLLGYAPNELTGLVARMKPGPVGNPIPVISCHPYEAATESSHFLQGVLAGPDHLQQECVVQGKDGRLVPILIAVSRLQDKHAKPIGYVGIATDISALKQAQAQLLQKNRELGTFFDGALDMHCISDSQGVISEVNGAFQQALGYSAAELRSIPFLALIHPDEQKYVYQHLLVPILQQPVRNQINQFRRQDGTYRIIEWNAIGIDNLVYGSARDITERQAAEIQLLSLNQRLQLATQAAGQGIWESDYEQDRLLWDDRLWEIHGLEPGRADWTFRAYLTLVHPDDLPAFMDRVEQDSQNDTLWNQTRIIRPDGTIRYVETKGILIRDQQGKPVRAIGVMWDVTERKLAEATLQESEQRFREIADNVDEVFWIHSVEPFELLYINPAYERVFGIASAPDPNDTTSFLNTVLAEDQALVLAEFNLYRQGHQVTVQFRVQGTHPGIRWLQIRTFVMRDSRGVTIRYIGIVNDITSQKEKEFVLHQSLIREQELNQIKSQFVSTASHEFRTPLTTIQTSVDLIKLYLDLPTAAARQSVQHHLGIIQDQIETVTTLLSDLLTIGTIEAGKITFTPQWVDVAGLCEALIRTHFSERSDGRTVEVWLEGIPRRVFVDEKLLSHVLVNLLSNAFKFSSGISPRLRVVFGPASLLIQVIDAGIGIPASEQSSLFQAFSRASNTDGIQGTGLGLAIARQFVERHDGWIEVESEEKKGTTFTVTLPCRRQDQP